MSGYRFTLGSNKIKKIDCPYCGKKKHWQRWLDLETGEILPDHYGKCDNILKCTGENNPYHQGFIKHILEDEKSLNLGNFTHQERRKTKAPVKSTTSYIDFNTLKKSRAGYEKNELVIWLNSLFGPTITSDIICRYHIGTSKHWPGSTVFWQIDHNYKIRTGHIILYDRKTGKRVKKPYNCIDWAHNVLKLSDFKLQQCYFGSHLLKGNNLPVAIVESEKTAIIASIYYPQFIWLATCGILNLNTEKCRHLKGRTICLFPDAGGFEQWSKKAREIEKAVPSIRLVITDMLETKAATPGSDLADYLIKCSSPNPIPIPAKDPNEPNEEKGIDVKPNLSETQLPVTKLELEKLPIKNEATVEHNPCEKSDIKKAANLNFTHPIELKRREYYHYTFSELCMAEGEEKALALVQNYQSLSQQYATCSTFVIHNCKLLQTYKG